MTAARDALRDIPSGIEKRARPGFVAIAPRIATVIDRFLSDHIGLILIPFLDADPARPLSSAKRRERRMTQPLPSREDRRQLVGRHDLELRERAVVRPLVGAPATKLRRMPKAAALHVIVRDFDHQLRAKRLP